MQFLQIWVSKELPRTEISRVECGSPRLGMILPVGLGFSVFDRVWALLVWGLSKSGSGVLK